MRLDLKTGRGWRIARWCAGTRNASAKAVAWLVLICIQAASAAGDEQAADRGRRLYETGIDGNGRPIEAVLGESSAPIPGPLLSCAGCHGKDGRGRVIKGINPPDITWQNLTKPYALRVGTGRSRPPYSEPLVIRAIANGRDPGGRLLATAMPRFRLTPNDTADLVAYLRELGSRPDPGVGADTVLLGMVLPARAEQPEVHDAVRAALIAYAHELNHNGGIFGRQVEFSFVEAATDRARPSSAGVPTIDQTVLAALVTHPANAEHELARLARRENVPLVALSADKDLSPGRNVFYLSAGVIGELRALTAHAARQLEAARSRLAVIHTDDEDGRSLMATLRPLIQRSDWGTIDEVSVAPWPETVPDESVQRIASHDMVVVATPDARLAKMLSALGRTGGRPLVLLPGSNTALEWLPHDPTTRIRVLVGFAFDPLSPLSARAGEDRALADEHGIAGSVSPARTALAAAKLLAEGLRRAGRDLTRAKLIDAIETIQRFETDDLPTLSYGPRQHIGFTGAQIVPFDLARRQLLAPVGRIVLD
jgi:ABC-type branched-subunit amino acid transport system substrate-binding protein